MVQGLGFLSKKSWHTKNLDNQERVWMAEQRRDAEKRKTAELAKQIKEEREREELDRISGKKTTTDRGIDWMYQGSAAAENLAKEDAARRNEEFLLGKEFTGGDGGGGDFVDGEDQKTGIHGVLAEAEQIQQQQEKETNTSDSNYYQEPSVKDRNENFRLRVEDPMFHVSQRQQEKKSNHDKTKALYERVVGVPKGGEDDHDHDDTDEDSRQKKRKKERKRKKKKRRDEDDRRRESKRSRRSRSRSHERQYRKHRRRDRSPSRSEEEDSYYDGGYRRRDERHRHRHREDSYRHDYDDKYRHKRYDDESFGDDRRYRRREETSRYDDRQNTRKEYPAAARREEGRDWKKEGYGLLNSSSSSSNVAKKNADLGPDRNLLEKKRHERDAERRRIRETATSRRRITEDERARALQEMQEDAMKRQEVGASYAKAYHDDDEAPNKAGASFLTDMTKRTHGITDESAASLSERLAQNRHTNQRSHESFL